MQKSVGTNSLRQGYKTNIYICVSVDGVPVSLAVVQGAAGPQGLVVVLSPADEGHGRPEGSEEPDEHSQSDGAAPLQLCS